MTRDALRNLEGQVVLISGRKAEARRGDDGQQFICLRAVRCWRWDQQAGVDDTMAAPHAARIDHAWVQMPAGSGGSDMGARGFGAARVRW